MERRIQMRDSETELKLRTLALLLVIYKNMNWTMTLRTEHTGIILRVRRDTEHGKTQGLYTQGSNEGIGNRRGDTAGGFSDI